LVLAAQALIVLDRTEYARAEQPVALRLERTIVDGFRLLDLAVGPRQNLLRTRNRDADLVEDLSRHLRAEKIHDLLVHLVLHLGRRRTEDRRQMSPALFHPAVVRHLSSDCYSAASDASPPPA